MRFAVLVYQAGIANVFEVPNSGLSLAQIGSDGQYTSRKRLLQADFRTCEAFCAGLIAAGVKVAVTSRNVAGDVAQYDWRLGLADCPFRGGAHPPSAALWGHDEHDAALERIEAEENIAAMDDTGH